LSSLTMEAIAIEANVSNPLIYKYFDSRISLLQELLEREFYRFYSEIKERLADAADFDEVVRIVVTANFDEVANGNILFILRSQRDIERRIDMNKFSQSIGVGPYLVKRTMEAYPVTRAKATKMVAFGAGASQAAALHWRQFGGNRKRMIDEVIGFIYGGFDTFVD